jgi:simple sugar transport system permease protein
MRVNASIFFGLAATLLAAIFVGRSYWAYKLKVAGASPEAARYAGFSEKSAIWATLLIGGAAAGLAGLGEVAGPIGQLQRVISPGYGYSAIIIAFLGGLRPIGILFASFVFAGLTVGGELAQATSQLPYFATSIVEGTIFVALLAGRFFIDNRIQRRPR